ncbi:MAG TPA: tetratricopeptide repeat protein [Chitinophagales bacterium]|nr:tetratricopeptide repeat protein [Chitinophagales bacterium]
MKLRSNIPQLSFCSLQLKASFYKRMLLSMAMLLLVFTAFAQPVQELYKTANQQYKSSQFEQAAANYEKIIAQGYKTPEVYYNLGNCYYKLNKTSASIINYERALKLDPQDEDIQNNLKQANTRVVDKLTPVPQLGIIQWWDNMIDSKSSNGWGTYALVFIWLALVLFAAYFFTGLKKISLTFGTVFLLLSFAFLSLAFTQSNKEQTRDEAILTVDNTYVKSAPDENGNNLFMLHEGVKFQLLDQVGDWNKIRLIDGKVGWVEKEDFEKI